MAAVRRLISAPVADYTSLTMLESDEGFENNVLDAYILRVQKFEREVQVKNRGGEGRHGRCHLRQGGAHDGGQGEKGLLCPLRQNCILYLHIYD